MTYVERWKRARQCDMCGKLLPSRTRYWLHVIWFFGDDAR